MDGKWDLMNASEFLSAKATVKCTKQFFEKRLTERRKSKACVLAETISEQPRTVRVADTGDESLGPSKTILNHPNVMSTVTNGNHSKARRKKKRRRRPAKSARAAGKIRKEESNDDEEVEDSDVDDEEEA